VFGTFGDTGTPGAPNDGVNVCGAVDNEPPEIVACKFARRNLVFLRFNEPLHEASAETNSNYVVDGGIESPATAVLVGQTVVLLEFAGPLVSDVTYTLTIQNVQDTYGNPIDTPEVGTMAFKTPEVSITEIMYDNRGDDIEWIELYNTTNLPIDVSGWYLSDDGVYPSVGEGRVTLPEGTIIPSRGYIIVNIWNRIDFGQWNMPPAVLVVDSLVTDLDNLGNDGDNVALYNASTDGTLIDGSLSTAYPDLSTDGESIEKIDEMFPWGDEDTIGYNFRKCETPIGFQPGDDGTGNPLSDYATPGRSNGTSQDPAAAAGWRFY
jgi:hypothetical protein